MKDITPQLIPTVAEAAASLAAFCRDNPAGKLVTVGIAFDKFFVYWSKMPDRDLVKTWEGYRVEHKRMGQPRACAATPKVRQHP